MGMENGVGEQLVCVVVGCTALVSRDIPKLLISSVDGCSVMMVSRLTRFLPGRPGAQQTGLVLRSDIARCDLVAVK